MMERGMRHLRVSASLEWGQGGFFRRHVQVAHQPGPFSRRQVRYAVSTLCIG